MKLTTTSFRGYGKRGIMSEIEKLYENAGIEPIYYDCCKLADKYWDNENLADEYTCFDRYMEAVCPHNQECTDECKNAYDKTIYPDFTAEKQLSLIKWLAKTRQVHISCLLDNWIIEGFVRYGKKYDSFELALAGLINTLWQDLTEEEKQQVEGILE